MSDELGAAGCIRDILIGLFAVALLFVLAMFMNGGKLLDQFSPDKQVEVSEEADAEQQLIVFDASTSMAEMLSTKKVLKSLGINLYFDALKFNSQGNLESLTMRVENDEGKKEFFESADISSEAISFDAKLFIPQK